MAEFANARRGLRVEGSNFNYYTEGAYGIIFRDRNAGRIRKVYRARPDTSKAHCQDVFKAEITAYEIASKDRELNELIPAYYGTCSGLTIVDVTGKNVTQEFYPDLAFEAEFIDCDFQKLAVATRVEQARVIKLLQTKGIRHVIDTSVCLDQNGRIRKIIDFAMQEIELSIDLI
jgi:hypothetical protein